MGKYRLKGQVTVIASIILGLIAVLAVVCVRSSAFNVSLLQSDLSINLGLESVFSEYVRPLFEEYEVFGIKCDGKYDFCRRLEEYMEYNMDSSKGVFIGKNALVNIGLKDMDITLFKKLTDDNGRIFAEQIIEYMKYAAPVNLVETWLPITADLSDNETADKVYEEYLEIVEYAAQADENVLKTVKLIDEIHGNNIILQLKRLDNELLLINAVYNNPLTKGMIKSAGYFNILKQIIREADELKDKLNEIKTLIAKTEECCQKLEQKAAEGLKSLDAKKSMLSKELYDAYKEEYESFNGYIDRITYIDVKELIPAADFNIQVLEEFSGIKNLKNKEIRINELSNISTQIHGYEVIFEKMDYSHLKHNFSGSAYSAQSSFGTLKKIKDLITEGVMSLSLPDNISVSKKYLKHENLASSTVGLEKYGDLESLVNDKNAAEDILYNEYVIDKFRCFTSEHINGTGSLEYETEYILNGERNDNENLKAVIEKIVILRSGFNFAYLVCNKEKKEEALILSAVMLGFTQSEGIIRLGQTLLLYAWSYGEGVNDVKILLGGGRISLTKNDQLWKTKLNDIISLSFNGGAGDKNGLDYEDYLRLLLYMCGREKKYYRTMDMIESGLEDYGYEGVRLSELYAYVSGNVEFRIGSMFYEHHFEYGY